jgi:hypothetical protein
MTNSKKKPVAKKPKTEKAKKVSPEESDDLSNLTLAERVGLEMMAKALKGEKVEYPKIMEDL